MRDLEKQAERKHEHYLRNKDVFVEKARLQKEEKRRWLAEYKNTLACIQCGENHPATLDFHHRDPNEKEFAISLLPNKGWSVARMKLEIDKCDL